jgi:hypothetical protein
MNGFSYLVCLVGLINLQTQPNHPIRQSPLVVIPRRIHAMQRRVRLWSVLVDFNFALQINYLQLKPDDASQHFVLKFCAQIYPLLLVSGLMVTNQLL